MSNSKEITVGSEDSPHLSQEVCFDLLLGHCSESETVAIRDHLGACPRCEMLVREAASAWERQAGRSGPPHHAPVRGTRAVISWRDGLARLADSRYRWGVGLGLAAAAALLLVLLPWGGSESPADLLYWLPTTDGEMLARGFPDTETRTRLLAGLAAYDHRDPRRAVALLGELRLSGPLESMRRVYLGSALAWTGNYGEAAKALEGLPYEVIPEPWSGEARWILMVAYRNQERGAQADSVLGLLIDQPGEVGERARHLAEDR